MTKSVYEKMGIKSGEAIVFIAAPAEVISLVSFAGVRLSESPDELVDHAILCCITQEQMNQRFEAIKRRIKPTGKLWLAWPKGKKLGSALSLPAVIKIGYDYGLVESTNLSIDETWTALKFTWPKVGKKYNNSYGTLPS